MENSKISMAAELDMEDRYQNHRTISDTRFRGKGDNMNVRETLQQIANLETQKQNLSNQAAFALGQQIAPLDTELARLRSGLVAASEQKDPLAPIAEPAKRRPGRPKKEAKPNGEEATAS